MTITPGRQPTKRAIAANNYLKPRTNAKTFFRSFKLLGFPWLHNVVKYVLLNHSTRQNAAKHVLLNTITRQNVAIYVWISFPMFPGGRAHVFCCFPASLPDGVYQTSTQNTADHACTQLSSHSTGEYLRNSKSQVLRSAHPSTPKSSCLQFCKT